MAGKLDTSLIILLVLGIVALALTIVFGNPSLLTLGVGIMFAYPAYWALDIRHALAVRLYRNQALGIGLISIALGLLFVLFSIPSSPSLTSTLNTLDGVGTLFVFVTIFYWVDASVLAGRRSDPLLRDTLGWGRIRRLVWGTLVLFSALSIVLSFSAGLGPSSNLSGLAFPVTVVVFFVPLVSGSILLPVVARRSGDPLLRRQLRYFALFLLPSIVATLLFGVIGPFFAASAPTGFALIGLDLVGDLTYVAASYFLYRSARSLVPLNKIEPEEHAA